ncbi:dihydrofolate reductase [Actinoplanes teichomyceticus]|uniref:Dihydrofolate reductase n=1 Tax=Actinoplanes teichomyceticus TaxID=1867 RepID=A0A561WMV6_ACTTI|nr:dihydrofolate reductase [Actinoplanes teichomyceticus]TWG25196.1 dihydrofolate reductase [Actinoplanes teichomyceticus]GIF10265.1 dihydrofolate reductase [Actinoplanes teichomyceticus]
MTVHLIWAEAADRVIGAGGGIPWHVPGEQRIFKERTMGATVVMGRATWDSLPRRPLPGRRNVVLTRDRSWRAEGADVAHDPADIGEDDFWVMGGAAVYAAFLPRAGHIVRTTIDLHVPGDTFAPGLGPEWAVTASTGWRTAPNGVRFVVEDLVRRAGTPHGGA